MGGASSLRGLAGYQQRYVTVRVLGELGRRALAENAPDPVLIEFSIEGQTSDDAPSWDVRFAFSDGNVDLHECKDTTITRSDRLAFYDRLRKEVASGTPAERIGPVWVADPDKQSKNALKYLGGIPAAVESLDLSGVNKELPDRMDSTALAIQEAVFRLCHYTGEEPTKAGEKKKELPRLCSFEEAKTLLKRLQIARHRFDDLEQSVKLLATGLLTKGTAAAIYDFVTGVLTERIVKTGEARFTIDALLAAVGTTVIEVQVEGRVRNLLSFRAASGFTQPIRLVRWVWLPDVPTERWTLAERIPAHTPGQSCLVVAAMGIGKTVASQMAFVEAAKQRHPGRVLRVEARTLDAVDLDALVRLCCVLCGVGPTWLAIDGLDEISNTLRTPWERSLGELTALPDLTLFATVRREVLAAREWIANVAASLDRVEMLPLTAAQVRAAFTAAGMPEPSNVRLVEALRNPFLLSLYAEIVTPEDMPLAESGEVTAFLVVDEFWKRRVRGVSEGQRTVGESEQSREPKRAAALYLSEKTLSGELVVGRGSGDSQLASGIEMLLNEGVIRERGNAAVVWIHDWIREYALVDVLVSRCDSESAQALARRILADCGIDYVGRSAAAAGMKWVVANPSRGTPSDFLAELWSKNPGYAREALAVLLEGSSVGVSLSDLTDDLLVEAINLATHLRATQWGGEVGGLADKRYFGVAGDRLHTAGVEYELTVAQGDGEPEPETVRRLVDRDRRRWHGGKPSVLVTVAILLEKIITTGVFHDTTVRSWLVDVAGYPNQYILGRVRDAMAAIISAGDVETGLSMFRALVGMDDPARFDAVASKIVRRQYLYENDVIGFLTPPLIRANPATWGAAAIAFLAKLVEAKQLSGWPSTLRFMQSMAEHTGVTVEADTAFVPEFDQEPRISTLDQDEDEPIVQVAAAIREAISGSAASDDPQVFHDLAELAVRARFASIVILPLLVLYDAAGGGGVQTGWHLAETARLLSDMRVASLESLGDVRRLLRRGLPDSLGDSIRAAIVHSIREAKAQDRVRIRELSDLQAWGVLTTEEATEVGAAVAADEIDPPEDPRMKSLFTVDRNPPFERTDRETGWPYPEDDASVRLLQRGGAESDLQVDGGAESTPLAQQLQSLGVVMSRSEAIGEEWLGRTLGWGHRAIRQLRRTVEKEDGDDSVPQLSSATWRKTLDENAPWWGRIVDAAIARLGAPLPESHAKREMKESRLSWMSGDPILHSADLLDSVLAIDPDPPFDEMQTRFIDSITSKWKGWPPFTRASILSSLRPWFWSELIPLRTLLGEIVTAEAHPVVLRYAVDRLVDLAWAKPTADIPEFVRRATAGGHADALRRIAHLLGEAVACKLLSSPGNKGSVLEGYYRECLDMVWADAVALSDFLHGALAGIVDTVRNSETVSSGAVWRALLAEIDLIATRWPFDALAANDHERFPVHVLLSFFRDKASAEERSGLFVGLAGAFETILRSGDLPAFCTLHHELKGLIAGHHRFVRGGREKLEGLQMSEAVEDVLMRLAKASVERVATWKQEGKTTNDHGWIDGLDGRDSSELVKCCLEASRDKSRMKRILMPNADILAGAGKAQVAGDLFAYLRKS
jgi:hypothetical protein